MRELDRLGVEASGPALLAAVEAGDAGTTGLLLQARVFSGQRDASGNSPLHIAIDHMKESDPRAALLMLREKKIHDVVDIPVEENRASGRKISSYDGK